MRRNASTSTAAAIGSLSTSTPLQSKMTNGPSDGQPQDVAPLSFSRNCDVKIPRGAAMQRVPVVSCAIMHRKQIRTVDKARPKTNSRCWNQFPDQKKTARRGRRSIEFASHVGDAACQQIFGDLALGR